MSRHATPHLLRLASVSLLLAMASQALAQAPSEEPVEPEQPRPIAASDLAGVRQARSLALSPDGRLVVWEEWRSDGERGTSDLWLASVDGKQAPRRLSFGDKRERHATWSPDGRQLYYSQRGPVDGELSNQVFRLDLDTGKEVQITELAEGVDRWALSPVGDTLYLVSDDSAPREDPFASLRRAHDAPTYVASAPTRSTVHALDLRSWRSSVVETGEHAIYSIEVSPDGRYLALLTAPDSPLIFREGGSEVVVVDRQEGDVHTVPDALFREQAPSPFGWLSDLAWDPEGRRLAFSVGFDGHPARALVATLPEGDTPDTEAGGNGQISVAQLPADGDWSLSGALRWHPRSGELCFAVSDHAQIQVRCQDPAAPTPSRLLTPQRGVLFSWDITPRGREVVGVLSTVDSAGEVVVLPAGREGVLRTLSQLNPQLDELALPQVRSFTWTAPDGVEVEGILELPPGYEAERDGPLPTVIHLHGGPTWASHEHLRLRGDGRTTFAARGWALLSPNYRGSTGYGDEFMVELIGRENDVEVADILSGVDALVEAGVADPHKLAVMGWSNGGYLTNCLITRTDRFKAASSGAGVFDQTIQWALEDTPGHVINYMEGLPWEEPEETRAASPLFAAGEISTPTIIHVGEHDPRVPAAHARALHRALSFYLDVPTELLIYPGEGHGLSEQAHREARVAWDEAWFDRYVLGTGPASGEEPEPEDPAEPAGE